MKFEFLNLGIFVNFDRLLGGMKTSPTGFFRNSLVISPHSPPLLKTEKKKDYVISDVRPPAPETRETSTSRESSTTDSAIRQAYYLERARQVRTIQDRLGEAQVQSSDPEVTPSQLDSLEEEVGAIQQEIAEVIEDALQYEDSNNIPTDEPVEEQSPATESDNTDAVQVDLVAGQLPATDVEPPITQDEPPQTPVPETDESPPPTEETDFLSTGQRRRRLQRAIEVLGGLVQKLGEKFEKAQARLEKMAENADRLSDLPPGHEKQARKIDDMDTATQLAQSLKERILAGKRAAVDAHEPKQRRRSGDLLI